MDCDEKDHTNFDLLATQEAKQVYLHVLLQAMRGIVARGGMPGLATEEDIIRLQQAAEKDLISDIVFGMQMKWVWGRKEH